MIRFLLLLIALALAVVLIATHGVRGIAILIVLALIATVPRTRGWRAGERWLVRLTGSRRRAAGVVLAVVIGAMIAVNVYEFVH